MPARIPTKLERAASKARRNGQTVEPVVEAGTLKPLPVTYPYGVKNDSYAAGHHTGEDHACPIGSLAISTVWGEVVQVSTSGGSWGSAYGTVVVLRARSGHDVGYCHLSKTRVKVGDVVRPGTIIGETGNSGNSTGPHLHFEVRPAGGRYGSDVDPVVVKRTPKGAR
ncbi:hypothetical protein GCM10022215_17870 [Nocardioides fonticola]|uniref:M23ase beta-sheet core domain-containing protein n=1 Tax=Nocardioides fonticola TaxID=450363 RepID=A0ABP7XHR4_9ACTN